MSIPGIVEAAATMPVKSAGVPRLTAKGFRTGSFDIVELKMAKAPIMHRIQKYQSVTLLIFCKCIDHQLITFW